MAYNFLDKTGITHLVSKLISLINAKADSGHTHNYAGSSTAGGAATSANKVNSSLAVKLNGGTTEGTNLFTFDGSAAKTVNITPASIGAETSGAAATALTDAKSYTDTKVASLVNSAPETLDTLGEIATALDENGEVVDALQLAISGKADNEHTHTVSDISDLTATAAELNYMDGVTSSVQTQLNGKVSDMTIEIYNGTGGNPKPVKFMTANYTTCTSEAGVAIKISMVSGHGNGSSYAFLQDVIIKVGSTGSVTVDNFKYYGADAGTYDSATRQYGDIFWVIDTTNKIVDFYCLMGQYSRVYQSPFKRVTYSTGGTVTQYTSCTVYSSGDKVYGNNSDIALTSDAMTTDEIDAAIAAAS